MSIFTRIKDLIRSNKAPVKTIELNPFEDSKVGDIINVDLEEYVVSGKVKYFDIGHGAHRFAYYLRSGKKIACLLVDKGRTYDCLICEFVEGSLDDPNDVPSVLTLGEGVTFNLEYYRTDRVEVQGNTDFRSADNVLYWRYLGTGESYFILQWQDGKYVAMEAERVPQQSIKFMAT
jgi:uncharacterized ParB-like nuclease family protein